MAASRGRPFASGGESGGPDTEDARGQVTVGQIASLKQSVSELRRDIIGAPTTDDKHREHSLEDENLNLKIRMRQLEEVVAGLSEQATGEAAEPDDVSTNVSALRSELSSLALGMDQKQGELLQARRDTLRLEAQLEESQREADAEAALLRHQLASARTRSEMHSSLREELWQLLNTFLGEEIADRGIPKDLDCSSWDQQLVVGLGKLRDAHDQQVQRAGFLDSELEAAAKQIAELEHELLRRDAALAELQHGLVSAMHAVENRVQYSPSKIRSPVKVSHMTVQTSPMAHCASSSLGGLAGPSSPPKPRKTSTVSSISVQTNQVELTSPQGLDDKYLASARAQSPLETVAETAQAAGVELMKLRGRVEALHVELNLANENHDAETRARALAEDKLDFIQEELVEARRGLELATQGQSAERRERMIVEEKLARQLELSKEKRSRIEQLETHLLDAQVKYRDLEIQKMQAAARVKELEANNVKLLSRVNSQNERRRDEKIREQDKIRKKQEADAQRPHTTLEARVMNRERRDHQYNLEDRCAKLEAQVELQHQALREQAQAAAKVSAKLLLERDRLILYTLSVMRSWQTGGRHAPAQVAEALAQCNFHSVQWDEVGDEDCGTLKEVTTFYQS